MLFFQDKKKKVAKHTDLTRPRTISEIKRLQSFVKSYKNDESKSLGSSMKHLAAKDESFNEFLKTFKAKNEQGWASITDMTQSGMEDKLLETTPEMRKNQMVMMEEFRRRKNLKDYWQLIKDDKFKQADKQDLHDNMPFDLSNPKFVDTINLKVSSGPEQYLEPEHNEVLDA